MKPSHEPLSKETLILSACQSVAEAKVAYRQDSFEHRRLSSILRALRQMLPKSGEKVN